MAPGSVVQCGNDSLAQVVATTGYTRGLTLVQPSASAPPVTHVVVEPPVLLKRLLH